MGLLGNATPQSATGQVRNPPFLDDRYHGAGHRRLHAALARRSGNNNELTLTTGAARRSNCPRSAGDSNTEDDDSVQPAARTTMTQRVCKVSPSHRLKPVLRRRRQQHHKSSPATLSDIHEANGTCPSEPLSRCSFYDCIVPLGPVSDSQPSAFRIANPNEDAPERRVQRVKVGRVIPDRVPLMSRSVLDDLIFEDVNVLPLSVFVTKNSSRVRPDTLAPSGSRTTTSTTTSEILRLHAIVVFVWFWVTGSFWT
jgi:hypothetical protein